MERFFISQKNSWFFFPIANTPPSIYIFYEFLVIVHDSGKLFKVSKEESSITYNGFWLRGCAFIF